MSVDIFSASYFPLREAAKLLPGHVSLSTLHRWRTRGLNGVKLSTLKVGHRRMVTAAALQDFFQAVTAAADGTPLPIRTSRQRQRAIEAAEKELAREFDRPGKK